MARILILRGDLTRQTVDAIVNAANPQMLGGGGVDGAIHRAAGPELLAACRQIPAVDGVRCPTGQARVTPGFALPAHHVIHTVGPIYTQSADPAAELTGAYHNCLTLAVERGLRSVAFPAISCGVYGYPLEAAAAIAIGVARAQDWDLDEIRFVLFDDAAYQTFQTTLENLQ